MYNNWFSSRHPGLVVFLIDQSMSMEEVIPGKDYSLAQMVSDAINVILNKFLYNYSWINADGTDIIKKTTFFCIIGYGTDWYDANILLEDWIDNINKPLVPVKDLLKTELKDKWNNEASFVEVYKPPINGGGTPMASAFSLAKGFVEYWVESHNDINDPAPLIINITDGFCTDDQFELISNAKDIMSIDTPDGNPVIFNIHISTFPNTPINEFPHDSQRSSDELYKLLYEASSTISGDLADGIYLLSERELYGKGKLFVYNVADAMELFRYLHFALEFSFHHNRMIRVDI